MVISSKIAEGKKTETEMLDFVRLEGADADIFIKNTDRCPFFISAYSAGHLIMWSDYYNAEFAKKGGYFFIKLKTNGEVRFMFPFRTSASGASMTDEEALGEIEEYCMKNCLPLVFAPIPSETVGYLAKRYRNCRIFSGRNSRDYLYRAENMREFKGGAYSGQRNHVNRFKKVCPGAYFTEYSDGMREKCLEFFDSFENLFVKTSKAARRELALAKKFFFAEPLPHDRRGVCVYDGRVISVCYGERCSDMLVIHIEKALPYEGIYPFTVQSFARLFAQDVIFINREDDAGDEGLRTSKTQYKPCEMIEKIEFRVYNELSGLDKIPEIQTERLTLSEITERDIPSYNRLCLDDERNIYWGYDYRDDLRGELYERYFFNDAADCFEKRVLMSLAVRLDGELIGEAVLYDFDCRGGAKAGVRILPEYAGHGYGREAMKALVSFALYSLELDVVRAHCFRENTASFGMLSALMRKTGEDEKYFYFERRV